MPELSAPTPAEQQRRCEVRAWIRAQPGGRESGMLGMSGPDGHSPAFSRALGAVGLLGLTLPAGVGGQGRTAVDRFVVTEELLAAQAPVAAHWVADRQSAPVIARHGSDELKATLLPGIIRGESYFSIGMSEPGAGSDLASVTTAAVKVDGGWRVSGTKVWTTLAHLNDWFIVLCRTSPGVKHEGLSQLIVDLRSPGVTVSPIRTLDGAAEFCEVVLDDVFVPDAMLLGEQGQGWRQVTEELSFERGGPDRYLSVWRLVEWWAQDFPDRGAHELGALLARYRVVRELAHGSASAIDRGQGSAVLASMTKDLGTVLEQDTIDAVRRAAGAPLDPDSDDPDVRLLCRAVLTGVTFTLRGGTTEVLRSLISRGRETTTASDDLLEQTLTRMFASRTGDDGTFDEGLWHSLEQAGMTRLALPASLGGEAASPRQVARAVTLSAQHVVQLPLADHLLLGSWLLGKAGQTNDGGPVTVAVDHALSLRGGELSGPAGRVPYGEASKIVLALVDGYVVTAVVDSVTDKRNLAGEPNPAVEVGLVSSIVQTDATGHELALRHVAARVLQVAGAARGVRELTARYANERVQFGTPIARFQGVSQQLALLTEEVACAEVAAELVTRWLEGSADDDDVAVAALAACRAATVCAKIGHQVHGAMGIAQEYPLQRLTRRLWTWRDDLGPETRWTAQLAERAAAVGESGLWPWMSR